QHPRGARRTPGPALAVARTGGCGRRGDARPRPAAGGGRGRLAWPSALCAAAAAGQRVGRDRGPAACPAARRRSRRAGRGVRPGAGARRLAGGVFAQPALALALALGRAWRALVRADALAPAVACRRAGPRAGVAGGGSALAGRVRGRTAARPRDPRGLAAARGKAAAAADPGAPARAAAYRRRGPGRVSKQVEVHTDGACLGNPGPGGWAALLR